MLLTGDVAVSALGISLQSQRRRGIQQDRGRAAADACEGTLKSGTILCAEAMPVAAAAHCEGEVLRAAVSSGSGRRELQRTEDALDGERVGGAARGAVRSDANEQELLRVRGSRGARDGRGFLEATREARKVSSPTADRVALELTILNNTPGEEISER